MDWRDELETVVVPAVARSTNIDAIAVAPGALSQSSTLLQRHFNCDAALVVADGNTWTAAGAAVVSHLEAAGITTRHLILDAEPRPKPTVELGQRIAREIGTDPAVPVVVGSGVLNDVVKFAAFEQGRPYFCVATAASMDGYASGGAPLSEAGFKKTIPCLPARVVVADLDVIAAAPKAMIGWGYGDLAGKMPAGGDWIVADALGIEARDNVAWPLVQANLRRWLADPAGVAAGEAGAVAALFTGLTVAGLAMEFHGTSRPASGADHQIAHLWEMEGLKVNGEPAAHGACVSVGCLSALALYDWLIDQDLTTLDVARLVDRAPLLAEKQAQIAALLSPTIAERAVAETVAKHLEGPTLAARLETVRRVWPELQHELREHLMRARAMAAGLRAAGAPVAAADLGVSPQHHRATVAAARFIRSRYTILDLLDECGLFEDALDAVFAATGKEAAGP